MSQVGKPIKKITIEPVENPVPQKETTPAPAPVPAEPEKVPA
jgi:hypothetical protein